MSGYLNSELTNSGSNFEQGGYSNTLGGARQSDAISQHIQALYRSNGLSDDASDGQAGLAPWSDGNLSRELADLRSQEAQLMAEDPVPIQTIQASDQAVPKLELNALQRHTQNLRSRLESGSVSSQQSHNNRNEGMITQL